MNFITFLNLAVFWAGVLVFYKSWGFVSLAFFKLITFMLSGLFYAIISKRFAALPGFPLKGTFTILIPLGVVLFFALRQAVPLFLSGKSIFVMAEVALLGAGSSLACMGLYFSLSKESWVAFRQLFPKRTWRGA